MNDDPRKRIQASQDGAAEARKPFPSALIPQQYLKPPEVADAWLQGFLDEYRRVTEEKK